VVTAGSAKIQLYLIKDEELQAFDAYQRIAGVDDL
jgi:hypothetical protein